MSIYSDEIGGKPHLRLIRHCWGHCWEATLPGYKVWGNTPLDAYRVLMNQLKQSSAMEKFGCIAIELASISH